MTHSLVPAKDELLVTFVDIDRALGTEAAVARALEVLSEGERARAARFKVEFARREHIMGRFAARWLLAHAVSRPPETLELGDNEWGRPALLGDDAASRRVRFNLSHSHGLVACVTAWEGEVGVDVEDARRDVDELLLAEEVFAPSEVAAVRAAPEADRRTRFFFHWTMKEAYIKARGRGISLPLREIAFDRDAEGVPTLSFSPSFDDQDPEQWQLAELRWGNHHPCAVCASKVGGSERTLRTAHVDSLDALVDGRGETSAG